MHKYLCINNLPFQPEDLIKIISNRGINNFVFIDEVSIIFE